VGGPRWTTALRFSTDGILWAGGDSLWSCDGSRWRRVAAIPGGVVALAEDSGGRMWIGSGKGLLLFADDRLRTMTGPGAAAAALQPQGSGVLVGTWGDGLWHCTHQTCQRHPGISQEAHVAAMAVGTAGEVWVTADGALYHCGAVCKPFVHPELAAAGSLGPVAFDDGVVWVGSPGGGGIVRIENPRQVDLYTPDRRLPDTDIHALLPLRDTLWLATDAGLVRYAGSRFVPQASVASPALSLAVDSQGRLWVGTGRGLSRISANGQQAHILPMAGAVRTVAVDRAGHIWAGGPDGLVEIGDSGRIDHTPQLPNASVRDLAVDAHGSIWVATSGGLARWNQDAWRSYTRQDGLPSDVVWAVHADSRGGIWIGTYGAGAARFDGETFRRLNSSHGLPSNVVRQILDDGAGNIWFVTDLGLASLRLDLLPDLRPWPIPGWLLLGTGALLFVLALLLRRTRRGS
jgi:ligand-binding sensor domain-containing protein